MSGGRGYGILLPGEPGTITPKHRLRLMGTAAKHGLRQVLPIRDAAIAKRRYRTATGAARSWVSKSPKLVERIMPALMMKKAVAAVQHYFALVQRCNEYQLHRFDAAMLERLRRDFGLNQETVTAVDGEAHAALRPANSSAPRLGGTARLHRAGRGA